MVLRKKKKMETVIDYDTGEILSEKKKFFNIDTSGFILVFPDYTGFNQNLSSSALMFLFRTLRYMRLDEGYFVLSHEDRNELSKEFEITDRTISLRFKELSEANLLRKAGGRYYVNPYFCFKGSHVSRKKFFTTWESLFKFDKKI